MKITADTNLLLRAILEDDPDQATEAQTLIDRAELVAVPVPVFCEMVWTMRRLYKRSADEIANAIEALLQVETVATDRPAVEAGIEVLRRGGDFADGVIAWLGMALGGTVLATFDKTGIRVLEATGLLAAEPAKLLSEN
ncbi:MAG: type II toxin-antitoxin system VapC family toxin [Clostridiaceae bacterium]|nr:type II toxin-antitoxin system VapC family toxin [Clostridiaceae bacterium]